MRLFLMLALLVLAAPAAAAPTYPTASEGGPVALSPDGRYLVTGCAAKVAKVWDVESGRLLRELKGPGPAVTERSFSPDSTYEVSDMIDSLGFDADGKRLATAGEDGFVRVWSVADGKLLQVHEDGYEVYGVAFSPAGDRVGYINNSTRYLESSVVVWDLATDEARSTGPGHDGTIAGFRFHPDGKGIVSWGSGTVKVWNGEETTASWEGSSAAWSPDGKTVAVGRNGTVVIAETGAEATRTLSTGGDAAVHALHYSADGTLLAGLADSTLVVWEVGTGRKLFEKPVGRLFGWTRAGTIAIQARDGRVAWLNGRTGRALQSAPTGG